MQTVRTRRLTVFIISCSIFAGLNQSQAQLSFYDDRGQFQADHPGLPVEDFEDLSGTIDPDGLDLIGDVVDSTTNDGPIQPGDIENGIVLTTIDDGFDGLAVLNPASPEGVESILIGPNLFTDSLAIAFVDAVDALAFELFSFENEPGMVDITFFNGQFELKTITVEISMTAVFIGVASIGPGITHVEFSNELDMEGGVANGELIDRIEFRLADPCILGDANQDSMVNLLDIPDFVSSLLNQEYLCQADLNFDGVVDLLDVAPFVDILNAL